jgi:putative transposase
MELTLQLQLLPDAEQATRLQATVERFNAACPWLAEQAFAQRRANKVVLQRQYYTDLRARFGLSAQMAVRCIARVVGAYKRDKRRCPTFRPHAAMPYDQRLMSFKGLDRVSLLTLEGRVLVPFVMGAYQRERFTEAKGQCHLVLRDDGRWFLLVIVKLPNPAPLPITDFLGVDLGVVNLATTSDGTTHSGAGVEACRTRYARRRQRLQRAAHRAQMHRKRPKNIRRALKRTARREARFRRNVHHALSKTLVAVAEDTSRGIALENLQDIRRDARFRKPQRARMTGWAFAQLRRFVEYKAHKAGVPVALVDPKHTSQGCNICGHVARGNRRSQAIFSCKHCDYTTHADVNAALNIRHRARVNAPEVAGQRPQQLLLLAGAGASDKPRPMPG